MKQRHTQHRILAMLALLLLLGPSLESALAAPAASSSAPARAGEIGWSATAPLDIGPPSPDTMAPTVPDAPAGLWLTEIVDSAGDVGLDTALALDGSGNPRISYYDQTNGNLKYARWTGAAWQVTTVDSAGDVGHYTSLALDSSGNPRISYYDQTNGNLKYARWDGAAWQIQTVDSAGDVGEFTSLALDGSGNPRIAYYDVTNLDLKYARWTGVAWQIETVDSAGADVGRFPSLRLDGSGNPHISYWDVANYDLKYARWTGAAWQISIVDSADYVGAYNSLRLDGSGNPHISYFDGITGLKYARWTGAAWQTSTVDGVNAGMDNTSLALDGGGNPRITYYDATNHDLKYAAWDGAAWQIEVVDAAVDWAAWASLALDGGGNPRISYYDWANGDLKYAQYSVTTPGTWQLSTVESAGYVGQYPALALDGSGRPHISYYDASNQDLKYARWDGAAWQLSTVDSVGNVGWDTSIALDGYGYPHISYLDRANEDLKYARWNGAAWQVTTVDSAGSVGWNTSLALDGNGNPRIAYYDSTNGDLKYARWTGAAWQITTVDSAGSVGIDPALALDSSGNPRISYYDSTNGDLKYARWTGAAWQVSVVDSTGDVGWDTSLALDSSGNPRISYYDAVNQDLKYARWDGAAWQIAAVDSAGNVGQYTSLALDSSGNPRISYYDVANQDLKYARWDGTAWKTEVVDSAGNVGIETSLALYRGNPHISYGDYTNFDLEYARFSAVTAVDDQYSTPQNTPLVLPKGSVWGVLDNDAPSNQLKATLLTPPAQGTVSMAADGSFTYTPPTGFSGQASFTYAATLRSDPGQGSVATVRILVGTVNRPTDIRLNPNSVSENKPSSTLVGTLSTVGGSPVYRYELVPGAGSADNAAVYIDGDKVRTFRALDYEQQMALQIRVRTTDGQGLTLEKALSVQILNVAEPSNLPSRCRSRTLEVVLSPKAHVWISEIVTATQGAGCTLQGKLNVAIPGSSTKSVAFNGRVDGSNNLFHNPLPALTLSVAGVDVRVGLPELQKYGDTYYLALRQTQLCAPTQWGGACTPGDQANLRVDAGGFRALSGKLPMPEFKVLNAVPLEALAQAPEGSVHVPEGEFLDALKLSFTSAEIKEEKDDQGRVIGYEVTGAAYVGLPWTKETKGGGSRYVDAKRDCHLEVVITLFVSVKGEIVMQIEPAPEDAALDAVEFREGKLTLACDKGIPIGQTGLQFSSISGVIALRPDSQFVRLEVGITNIENLGLPLQLLQISAGISLLWKPEWGIDLSGDVTILESFTAAQGSVEIRKYRMSLAMTVRNLYLEGNLALNAWWPDYRFHFSGSAMVAVGLAKGAIWEKCVNLIFKKICVSLPPWDLRIVRVGAEFGEFKKAGKVLYGGKGYVHIKFDLPSPIPDVDEKFGFFSDGRSISFGGLDQYQLVTPPDFAAAYRRWQADQRAAALEGVALDPMTWDDTFAFPRDDQAVVKVTLMPTEIISQVYVVSPTDAAFILSIDVPATVTLVTPDGITITPDNYYLPPVSPTHAVAYTYTVYPTYTQYWYQVGQAMIGAWQVGIEGPISGSNPVLVVLGFANIPQLTDVVVLDAGDPSQVEVGWEVTSDVYATMTVYANPGPITASVVVTDGGGMTSTEIVYTYHGFRVGEFPLHSRQELRGASSGIVDLTGLESGNYALWVALDDGDYPALYAYALVSGTEDVAWVTVDNSATWPVEWSPPVTPTIFSDTEQLVLDWGILDHPDVDDYTIYIGTAPNAPAQAILGLGAFVERDDDGNIVGGPLVEYTVNDVVPGATYYFSFAARDEDADPDRTVRTAEFSVTIPAGDYALDLAQAAFYLPAGVTTTFSVSLTLDLLEPLFYPNVYLALDEEESTRGILVQFNDDVVGETALTAVTPTVAVHVAVDQYVPTGAYKVTIVGYNGERMRTVDLLINVGEAGQHRIFLPLVFRGYVPAP